MNLTAEQVARLEAAGWTVERSLMYDDEGVEGWEWTAPDGREAAEVGAWEYGPAVPDELIEAVRAELGR